jgi:hypothetical protein
MTGDFWVLRLNGADAARAWPKALPLLAPAIARSEGLYLPADVEDLVTRPNAGTADGWSLWLIGEKDQLLGAWTTRVGHFPRARIVETVFAGGASLRRWYEVALAETEKFARETGCARLRCAGRRGWARLGYRQIGFTHERTVA